MPLGIDDIASGIITGTASELTRLFMRKMSANIYQAFGQKRMIYLSYADRDCPYGKALTKLMHDLQFNRHFVHTHGCLETGERSQCIDKIQKEKKLFMLYLLSGIYHSSPCYDEMVKTADIRTSRKFVVLGVPEFNFPHDAHENIQNHIDVKKQWISLTSNCPTSKQECRNRVFNMAIALGYFLNLEININTLLNSLDIFMDTICSSQQTGTTRVQVSQSRAVPQITQNLVEISPEERTVSDGTSE